MLFGLNRPGVATSLVSNKSKHSYVTSTQKQKYTSWNKEATNVRFPSRVPSHSRAIVVYFSITLRSISASEESSQRPFLPISPHTQNREQQQQALCLHGGEFLLYNDGVLCNSTVGKRHQHNWHQKNLRSGNFFFFKLSCCSAAWKMWRCGRWDNRFVTSRI